MAKSVVKWLLRCFKFLLSIIDLRVWSLRVADRAAAAEVVVCLSAVRCECRCSACSTGRAALGRLAAYHARLTACADSGGRIWL